MTLNLERQKKILDSFLSNPLMYVLIGALLAIVVARTYVFLGGTTDVVINGITFHHFFFGVALIAVVGILAFIVNAKVLRNRRIMRFLAFLFGFGIGLVVDETNLFLIGGLNYTGFQYYLPADVVAEFVVVLIMFLALVITVIFDVYGGKRSSAKEKLHKR
jgi:Ca2+/H+ antiporter